MHGLYGLYTSTDGDLGGEVVDWCEKAMMNVPSKSPFLYHLKMGSMLSYGTVYRLPCLMVPSKRSKVPFTKW